MTGRSSPVPSPEQHPLDTMDFAFPPARAFEEASSQPAVHSSSLSMEPASPPRTSATVLSNSPSSSSGLLAGSSQHPPTAEFSASLFPPPVPTAKIATTVVNDSSDKLDGKRAATNPRSRVWPFQRASRCRDFRALISGFFWLITSPLVTVVLLRYMTPAWYQPSGYPRPLLHICVVCTSTPAMHLAHYTISGRCRFFCAVLCIILFTLSGLSAFPCAMHNVHLTTLAPAMALVALTT